MNSKGQVDFEGLAKKPKDLNDYVAYISKKDLYDFPTVDHRMAHWINAYNALSMYNVIKRDIPDSNSGLNKVGFFFLSKFIIGGKKMSLYSFENDLIRKLGDERVHFALNCMAVSCPRLPKTPFTGDALEKELNMASKEFFSKDWNLKINNNERVIHVSKILDFFTEDFTPLHASSLGSYINKWIDNPNPDYDNYKVKFFDYDWTVNNSNRL